MRSCKSALHVKSQFVIKILLSWIIVTCISFILQYIINNIHFKQFLPIDTKVKRITFYVCVNEQKVIPNLWSHQIYGRQIGQYVLYQHRLGSLIRIIQNKAWDTYNMLVSFIMRLNFSCLPYLLVMIRTRIFYETIVYLNNLSQIHVIYSMIQRKLV